MPNHNAMSSQPEAKAAVAVVWIVNECPELAHIARPSAADELSLREPARDAFVRRSSLPAPSDQSLGEASRKPRLLERESWLPKYRQPAAQ